MVVEREAENMLTVWEEEMVKKLIVIVFVISFTEKFVVRSLLSLDLISKSHLKLPLFNLSLVMCKSISPCISWPNSLVASKYFFTSSFDVFFKVSCRKLVSQEKSAPWSLNKIVREIIQYFCFFFFMYSNKISFN